MELQIPTGTQGKEELSVTFENTAYFCRCVSTAATRARGISICKPVATAMT